MAADAALLARDSLWLLVTCCLRVAVVASARKAITEVAVAVEVAVVEVAVAVATYSPAAIHSPVAAVVVPPAKESSSKRQAVVVPTTRETSITLRILAEP